MALHVLFIVCNGQIHDVNSVSWKAIYYILQTFIIVKENRTDSLDVVDICSYDNQNGQFMMQHHINW